MKKNLAYILSVFILAGVLMLPTLVFAQETPSLIVCTGAAGSDPCGFDDLLELANAIMTFVITISIPVSAGLFIWAGVLYLTAGANVSKAQKAKGIFINVAIGLAIIICAWLIVYTVVAGLTDDPQFLRFLQ